MDGDRDTLVAHVTRLVRLLKEYAWIYDYKVTEFFANRVWEKIPDEWRSCLLQMSAEDLRLLPTGVIQGSWPASLQAFVREATTLGLRSPCARSSSGGELTTLLLLNDAAAHEMSPAAAVEHRCSASCSWRGVTPKKTHEVVRMASLIDRVCCRSNCGKAERSTATTRRGDGRRHLVIDVGSGLGYLGEHLAEAYSGYDVIGLECVGSRAHTAQHKHGRRGSSVADALDKPKTAGVSENRQQQLGGGGGTVRTVQFDLSSADAVRAVGEMVCAAMPTSTGGNDDRGTTSTGGCVDIGRGGDSSDGGGLDDPIVAGVDGTFVGDATQPAVCMVGLHCCGDLTPTAMRLFCQLQPVRSAVLVGCCYHKMSSLAASQGSAEGSLANFPLSGAVRMALASCGGDWRPSVYALRLAANETAAMLHHLTDADRALRRRHVAYRAVLEAALRRGGITAAKKYRKLVASKTSFDSFSAFADEALRRLRLPEENDCEQKARLRRQLDAVYEECEPAMPYVDVMSALQATVQDALESLIVLDRLLSLRESEGVGEAVVTQIFDSAVSPRNLAIVAWKRDD